MGFKQFFNRMFAALGFSKGKNENETNENGDDYFGNEEPHGDIVQVRKSMFDNITEPRASFTVTGFEDSRIKVEFDWNKAFIEEIGRLGFVAETEEDSVQLFFYASSMRPTSLSEASDDNLSSPEIRLANDTNRFIS